MAETLDIRNMILNTPLVEEPITIPGWNANLIIRELSGKAGSDLINACTDQTTQSVNQEALVAGVILQTLRNADDPNKSLIFAQEGKPDEHNPAYRDQLMSTGLKKIMTVALQSIALSGLDTKATVKDAKNASSATVVDGSLITSQAA